MLGAILGVVTPLLGKVLDLIPNKERREKARLGFELEMKRQEAALIAGFLKSDQGQIEINKQEAAHKSLFVAGWRPFVGWTCGFGCAWAFVIRPMSDWIITALGYATKLPELATGDLMSLLLGMLGMGALRSYEKTRGVARNK